jgi:ABC-type multidrug transport system ATPase subunit
MLQRIGLAQALLNQPTSSFSTNPPGLDPLGRFLVRDLIEELRGSTAVFQFSSAQRSGSNSDRVAFLKKGEVVRELNLRKSLPCWALS